VGVLRDLAMRGIRAVLVEKGDLTHGTSGRYHGLLHSGGRYVVKDKASASECAIENEILRRIMPHCIEDTGGPLRRDPRRRRVLRRALPTGLQGHPRVGREITFARRSSASRCSTRASTAPSPSATPRPTRSWQHDRTPRTPGSTARRY